MANEVEENVHKTDDAPHQDDNRKPDSPTDIKPPSWKFTAKNALREYGSDQLSDSAAAITYFAVLSMFPAVIALVSILSLLGQSGDLVRNLIEDLRDQGALPSDAMETITPVLDNLLETPAPGLGLILGILIALWTASNYVKAFARAMNRVYEVPEGRGFIKFNAAMYGLTALLLLLLAITLVLLAVSGPLARSVGDMIGLGDTAVTVFQFVKWPILALVIVVIVALLYWGTPNVKQPKFRWVSIGALVAIVVAVLATIAFGFYVSNFGSYDETYGALAGVIVFLFWLYIMNSALLFGAEIDAELERGRQLQGGIKAEEELQLPMRDDKAAKKKAEKEEKAIAEARELRLSAGESLDSDDDDSSDDKNRRRTHSTDDGSPRHADPKGGSTRAT